MSLSQFGYSTAYPSPASPLTSSRLLPSSSSTPSSSASPPSMSGAPCCEKGTPHTHPHTGHTICSCQYPPSAGMLPYSRLSLADPSSAPNAYSSIPGYGPGPTQNYVPLPPETGPLYPPLNSPYDLKETGDSWRGLGPAPGCYPYDPTTIPSYPYPNSYAGSVDIKRNTKSIRESTNTLKAWLHEHRKNPYPTKGEKIMLAIITKMTLTQVSTWFANARRRLKKENKMTWSPRNKPGDNDEDDDDEKDKNDNDDSDDETKAGGGANGVDGDDRRNDGRDSQSSGDLSAPDCSGVRGHPVTTQLFDPPHHQDQSAPSLASHFNAFDGSIGGDHGTISHGGVLGTASQQQLQHNVMSDRGLNYGNHQLPNHLQHNNNSNNNNNNSSNPLLYHNQQLPPHELQPMSPYAHHHHHRLHGQKSASLGYSPSPANQTIHDNTLGERIPQMPMKIEPPSGTSSMTRPDSLCSSSNDSGMNEVQSSNMGDGYPGGLNGDPNGGMMDGMRPKIWSLAHEATSDGGYINHGSTINTSSNNNNNSNVILLNNNKLTGYNNNNALTPNHNTYHSGNARDGIHQQQQQHNYDPSSIPPPPHHQSLNDESLLSQQQQHHQQHHHHQHQQSRWPCP